MVKVGEEQTLVYKSKNNLQHGPFHITPENREARWHADEVPFSDKKVGPTEKTNSELVEELMRTVYGAAEGINVLAKKLVRDLQKIAGNLGIDTNKMVTRRTRYGWENQGKCLLQVLYESGWIDESDVNKYKIWVL